MSERYIIKHFKTFNLDSLYEPFIWQAAQMVVFKESNLRTRQKLLLATDVVSNMPINANVSQRNSPSIFREEVWLENLGMLHM